MNCLRSQFVFSLVHLSQEWYGWAKNIVIFVSYSIILCSENSLPLSYVMESFLLLGMYESLNSSLVASLTHCPVPLISFFVRRYPVFLSTLVRITSLLHHLIQTTVSHSQCHISLLVSQLGYSIHRSSIILLSIIWYFSLNLFPL